MTTVHTLASSSAGNSLLLSCDELHVLVDAGISCRRISAALKQLDLTLQDIHALFITHTHTDHISGMQTLLKRSDLPIYTSARGCRELEYRLAGISDRLHPIELCKSFSFGACTVTAFPTSHDAPGSCGYRFDTPDGSVGLITDTGIIPDEAADALSGAELVVLEANHDVEALRSGPYPYYLKRRILSVSGHLCNEDAARFAVRLAASGTNELILAHLSQENNSPAMAQHAVETALSAAGLSPRVTVAPRDRLSQTYFVTGRSACKK